MRRCALSAAFPKFGAAWLVPFGTARAVLVWQGASWKRAALLGWFAGLIFFALDFAWVGHTVGHYIGVFGPFLAFGPALIEAPFFALAGALGCASRTRACIRASRRLARGGRVHDLRMAALDRRARGTVRSARLHASRFAAARHRGVCRHVRHHVRALRARRVCGRRVAPADVAPVRRSPSRRWSSRPSPPGRRGRRAVSRPRRFRSRRFKATSRSRLSGTRSRLAVRRYYAMTHAAAAQHPRLDRLAGDRDHDGPRRRSDVARRASRTSRDGRARRSSREASTSPDRPFYNALYIFSPNGGYSIYQKRQLVPFAEWFPGTSLPLVAAVHRQPQRRTHARARRRRLSDAPRFRSRPLICWESAFADLAYAQVRKGAQLLVISTDDAWFGQTSGPYMHAQIAQLRAIESGAYVVRAAATGISGIIAPDGTLAGTQPGWRAGRSSAGASGPRVPTLFSRIGPTSDRACCWSGSTRCRYCTYCRCLRRNRMWAPMSGRKQLMAAARASWRARCSSFTSSWRSCWRAAARRRFRPDRRRSTCAAAT